jgi:SAM-dependent methyltransferase
MPPLAYVTAARWIDRWERQQQAYLPGREARFTALIDAVEAGTGRPDPVVVDLGCGPGSLSARLLGRLPGATVVAVDADPLLLALGRAVHGGRDGLKFVDLDLRQPGWPAALGLEGPADAAVSTTALHWLPPGPLGAMYAELATVLRPGGLLLNGDHFTTGQPGIARLDRALTERQERRAADAATADPAGAGEGWVEWWEAAEADPELAGLTEERNRRDWSADHHGTESMTLAAHATALLDAGFSEVGTLWQYGDNRLLCAIRG